MIKKLLKQLQESRKRLIFISHKYRDNPIENKKEVDRICRQWYEKGYLPISPLHLFSFVPDDTDRKTIMIICKILILLCSVIIVYNQSGGCKEEEKFAIKCRKKVICMYSQCPKITTEEAEYMMTHPRDIIV